MAWITSLNWIILTGKQAPWTGGRWSHPTSTGTCWWRLRWVMPEDQCPCTEGFDHFIPDWLWFQCSYSTINKSRFWSSISCSHICSMQGNSMASFTIFLTSKEVTLQTGYQQYLWFDPFHNIFVYPFTPHLRRAFYGFKESLREKIKNIWGHLTPLSFD